MKLFGSESCLLISSATSFDFLLKPIFLHGFSASLHVVLLLFLLVIWVVNRVKEAGGEGSKERLRQRKVSWYKQTLACCFVVSAFNIVLCLLSYFYWYRNGWSEDKLVTLSDYVVKTLAWGATCVYLHCQFSNTGEHKRFPFLLRIWWGFYFSISCYGLVTDIVLYKRHVSFPSQYLVSDVFSVITGLFLSIVGFFGRNESEDTRLEEPFLNGDSSVGNGAELSEKKGGDTVTPYSNAGIFSILTFSWMGPLIAAGNKKTLDLEDVPQLDSDDSVLGAFPKFGNRLESADSEGSGVTTLKLVKALFLSAWKDILWTALFVLIYTVASYVGPYLIDTFVQYLNGQREFKNEGYLLVTAFFVAKLVECLSRRRWFFKLQQVGLRQRALLVAMIYNKGLTLSCQSKQSHTSGEIINFMTVDAERVGDFSWYMHDPWMVVLQVALALLILYKTLGLASIAAFVATVLVMLANIPLGKMLEKCQDKLMESKDRRMKATSEILRNMRILKLQGWEMKFLSKIIGLRNVEEGWLKRFVYTNAMTSFLFWVAPSFVSVATFGACMLLGVPLESGKILSALATFRILQEPIYNLPDTISMIAQTKVSLDRIASFLRLDDLQPDVIERLPRGSSDTAIEIADGNFSWDLSSPTTILKDINLKVSHGMSVAVCGMVGSGKSSLLSCILGELPKISGTLKLCGTKAYVAQSPWIQSGKIEDNILFGREMDRERYDTVLEACTLKKDLEILSFGDQTVIGERGINLSGGQKQRIQIARALYQDADIYLFDDPFSAVDAHTGSHLFKEVLLGILSSKTVIYVTHQVEFLPAADLILVMKDGRIAQAGKYNDILNSGTDFMELVGAHKKALSTLDTVEAGPVSENSMSEGDGAMEIAKQKVQNKENQSNESGKVEDVGPKGQLVQEEEREKGKVGFSVYWKYITTAYGGALVPLILLAQILFQIFQIGSNYWMAWASPVSAYVKPPVGSFTLIIVYLALAIASAFSVFARAMLLNTAGYKTATLLFKKMHLCVFRAPMSFFDSTPSGRILNRASTDQSAVDMNIPYQVGAFAFSVIQLLGIIAVMSQVAWQIFIIFIPVVATCIWYQQYYISSARELTRLVGVCKAPVIQHFAETILGATTIRSFDQESRFQETNMKLTDSYSRPKFHVAGAMEWLCFRLDLLSSITFAFSLFFLISIPEGVIDPAVAGLAVTYGLNLNILQASVVWNICNMESKIISVERILQYSGITSEPALVIETNRPDHSWPSHGEVHILDLQVRYAPHLPLVLRGLTCTFPGGLKSGIVGRTGSGKSTLIQTLFRIVEPAAGQIIIDDVNISSIGLHDLRSRLSIIPQDPTMFEGNIRSNLDPLEEYTDEQIWEALDKCQLGDEVRKKEGRLESSVSENGENWSMGQRQLVCLGRVLLKKSKILVLDEATASVDTATDNLIQTTLREHFSDCTVITIAHRITSVLDSDMVLLLSNGLIQEYDSPSRLLENKSSAFAQLVAEYTVRSNSSLEKFD
ncbi:ABC transporter C family member 3-like [Durio zibethinus]|uniref:ABC-type xenobiotic transporter n=1 Tax=Durio zibethinus TaxID=66656 RepID=A0A6P5Y4T5_DURZI|nr:ABC transporter C family member 3-like [Durio zibethinus]XP_022735022.1 ABC transporter C family member 3-like [Durio zibethinus]